MSNQALLPKGKVFKEMWLSRESGIYKESTSFCSTIDTSTYLEVAGVNYLTPAPEVLLEAIELIDQPVEEDVAVYAFYIKPLDTYTVVWVRLDAKPNSKDIVRVKKLLEEETKKSSPERLRYLLNLVEGTCHLNTKQMPTLMNILQQLLGN